MPAPTICLATAATTLEPSTASRLLTVLRERMRTPEIAAEAMRAYTHETNRLNRQRRSSSESTRRKLTDSLNVR
jgi:hypothetical protein